MSTLLDIEGCEKNAEYGIATQWDLVQRLKADET